jgi:hypothetical protein
MFVPSERGYEQFNMYNYLHFPLIELLHGHFALVVAFLLRAQMNI